MRPVVRYILRISKRARALGAPQVEMMILAILFWASMYGCIFLPPSVWGLELASVKSSLWTTGKRTLFVPDGATRAWSPMWTSS